jgi:murein DD-endopeptidase
MTGGLVLGTTVALGASLLAAGPANAAPPQTVAVQKQATVVSVQARVSTSRAARQQQRANKAIKFAAKQIGDPYRYGGTGPNSWDCSGLVGKAWRSAGVKMPRTTQQIYRSVKTKVSWRGARKGDLLFFYGGKSHVVMYVGNGYAIHAPSSGKRVKKIKLNSYYKRNFSGGVRPGL